MSEALFIHGDARRLPIDPKSIDAIVTDPPYGMNWDTDSTRYSGGDRKDRYGRGRQWRPVQHDDRPFDPRPWLQFTRVILWGSNHYAEKLPIGTTLVWIKKEEHLYGTFLSDAEIGWMKGGYGVYCFEKNFPPPSRMAEAGGTCAHPTQKPIALMRWCIQKLKLKPNSLIVDPYCGSGTTAIAAAQEGHRFIGLDLEREYLKIAWTRYHRPHKHIPRPGRVENHPLFDRLKD